MNERIWFCKIGGQIEGLPHGADAPMREAIQDAFAKVTLRPCEFIFSGWGGKLGEGERAVVENRLPRAFNMGAVEQALEMVDDAELDGLPFFQAAKTLAAEVKRLKGEPQPTHVAILRHHDNYAKMKAVIVPAGQSLDFDEGSGATRKWLQPYTAGEYHLYAFVPIGQKEEVRI